MQTAFSSFGASPEQEAYSTAMSAVRVPVEWNYKDLKQTWTRNDFARLLHARRFPFSLFYVSTALLLNLKTCMEGAGQVSTYFGCAASSFQVYINV